MLHLFLRSLNSVIRVSQNLLIRLLLRASPRTLRVRPSSPAKAGSVALVRVPRPSGRQDRIPQQRKTGTSRCWRAGKRSVTHSSARPHIFTLRLALHHILTSRNVRIVASRRRWEIRLLADTPGQVGDGRWGGGKGCIELRRNEGIAARPAATPYLWSGLRPRDHALLIIKILRLRTDT